MGAVESGAVLMIRPWESFVKMLERLHLAKEYI